jgi:ATP-binding cassette subfamily E protein 1
MDENKRIPIINTELCQPKKCKQECMKKCPVVMGGKICIDVKPTYKQAIISETLCIGCGICVKQCPFKAIKIINLPTDLNKYVTHMFGPNSFKMPTPKRNRTNR